MGTQVTSWHLIAICPGCGWRDDRTGHRCASRPGWFPLVTVCPDCGYECDHGFPTVGELLTYRDLRIFGDCSLWQVLASLRACGALTATARGLDYDQHKASVLQRMRNRMRNR